MEVYSRARRLVVAVRARVANTGRRGAASTLPIRLVLIGSAANASGLGTVIISAAGGFEEPIENAGRCTDDVDVLRTGATGDEFADDASCADTKCASEL